MSRKRHSDIKLKIDGQNHLLTPFESSHNEVQTIDAAMERIAIRLAQTAAEADFKAIFDAWQPHQKNSKGVTSQ